MTCAARCLLLAALVGAPAGCGGVRVAEAPLPAGLAWPPGDARVRLEHVFDARRGGKLPALFASTPEQPLFERPHGIAWSGGDLIVADPGARRLARIAPDGRVSWSAAADAGAPLGVAACGDELLATLPESGRVEVYDARLQRVRTLAEGLERPTGIACAGGDVFVAETGRHRVVVLGAAGARRAFGERGDGDGRFNFPTALALDTDTLYVGDTLNFRVQRVDARSGAGRGAWGGLGDAPGDLPRLKGLAIDAAGHVWVSDAHTDRVALFTAEGRLLLDLGGPGGDPGRFAFPAGIAAHADGRVAVVDSLNRRVQVFRLVPRANERPPDYHPRESRVPRFPQAAHERTEAAETQSAQRTAPDARRQTLARAPDRPSPRLSTLDSRRRGSSSRSGGSETSGCGGVAL